jgi:hypothetical protein
MADIAFLHHDTPRKLDSVASHAAWNHNDLLEPGG